MVFLGLQCFLFWRILSYCGVNPRETCGCCFEACSDFWMCGISVRLYWMLVCQATCLDTWPGSLPSKGDRSGWLLQYRRVWMGYGLVQSCCSNLLVSILNALLSYHNLWKRDILYQNYHLVLWTTGKSPEGNLFLAIPFPFCWAWRQEKHHCCAEHCGIPFRSYSLYPTVLMLYKPETEKQSSPQIAWGAHVRERQSSYRIAS